MANYGPGTIQWMDDLKRRTPFACRATEHKCLCDNLIGSHAGPHTCICGAEWSHDPDGRLVIHRWTGQSWSFVKMMMADLLAGWEPTVFVAEPVYGDAEWVDWSAVGYLESIVTDKSPGRVATTNPFLAIEDEPTRYYFDRKPALPSSSEQ